MILLTMQSFKLNVDIIGDKKSQNNSIAFSTSVTQTTTHLTLKSFGTLKISF
jgi:hypothetical protein